MIVPAAQCYSIPIQMFSLQVNSYSLANDEESAWLLMWNVLSLLSKSFMQSVNIHIGTENIFEATNYGKKSPFYCVTDKFKKTLARCNENHSKNGKKTFGFFSARNEMMQTDSFQEWFQILRLIQCMNILLNFGICWIRNVVSNKGKN